MKLEYNDKEHKYFINGSRVPGVTEVLGALGLYPAYNPAGAQYHLSLGSAVHRACELHDMGTLDESTVDPQVRPFLDAYLKFKTEWGFTPTRIEEAIFHPKLGFAGRIDREGMLGSGESGIVELKKGGLPPCTALQTSAHELLVNEGFGLDGFQLGGRKV